MPHNPTRFAELVNQALDSKRLSPRDAHAATGVHFTRIYDMKKGIRVAEATIRKFAAGLDLSAEPFLVAAGYEPESLLERLKLDITELVYERRGGKKTAETDAIARRIYEKILADESLEHINGEPEL